MANLKQLTILHSNDLHGDFMAKEEHDKLLGGISLLSGYVNQTRETKDNVLYVIAGDMFRGSVIDSEYRGMSTIEIMNLVAPDVVTLGNHEVDYGLAHLLFLEKCANFLIINANMYIRSNQARLFESHLIKEIDGMNILFIGILTEDVISQTKQDPLIGALVDINQAAAEVGRICNSYRTVDIDFTVLLTHVGIEADQELAQQLDPRWGVDIIIGGHSHTYLEKPIVVAGIPIVQAAFGTEQIGRFDIVVNTDTNSIDSYTWQLVPINDQTCPKDEQLEAIVQGYREVTDQKYQRFITRLMRAYTHPARNQETELGKIFADAFQSTLQTDLVLVGSGSIRGQVLGPIIRYQDLAEIFPYNDEIISIYVTGSQLKRMIKHILRAEAFLGTTEFYQFSNGIEIEFDKTKDKLVSLKFHQQPVQDEDKFSVAIQEFHYNNLEEFLAVTLDEVSANKKPRVLSTKSLDLLEEYFSEHDLVRAPKAARLVILETK